MPASRSVPAASESAPQFAVAGPFPAPGAAALVLEGELDLATAPELDRRLREAEVFAPRVVVDMRRLEFMASSGLSALVASRERHRQRGAEGPGLIVADGQVRRVLELTGCDDLVEDVAALG